MEIDREKFEAILSELDRPQAWIAKRLGISRGSLHHYVVGRRHFPAELYPRMVALLGTTDFVVRASEKAAA